jgi:hypothetical protein
MKYADLFERLKRLNAEQLQQDVTVYDTQQDEFFALSEFSFRIADDNQDVLDVGHVYLVV